MARQNGEGGVKVFHTDSTPNLSFNGTSCTVKHFMSYRHVLAQEKRASVVLFSCRARRSLAFARASFVRFRALR